MALGAVAVLIYTKVFARTGLRGVLRGPRPGAAARRRHRAGAAGRDRACRVGGRRPGVPDDVQSAAAERIPGRAGGPGRRAAQPRAPARPSRAPAWVYARRPWRRPWRSLAAALAGALPAARADRRAAVLVCRARRAVGRREARRARAHSCHGRQRHLEPVDQSRRGSGPEPAAWLGCNPGVRLECPARQPRFPLRQFESDPDRLFQRLRPRERAVRRQFLQRGRVVGGLLPASACASAACPTPGPSM